MTEDLITELAQALDGLLRHRRGPPSFTYKGKTVRPEQVSRELGVRYIIEGSVRKANNRIRITAQLVDATTSYHVWAQYLRPGLDTTSFAVSDGHRSEDHAVAGGAVDNRGGKAHGTPIHSGRSSLEIFHAAGQSSIGASHQRIMRMRGRSSRKPFDLDPDFARAYAAAGCAAHRR